MLLGVDVSKWDERSEAMHSEIDWNAMARGGVRIGCVKFTQGNTSVSNRFAAEQLENGRKAGLIMGAYHYLDPRYNCTGESEASWFLKNIEPFKPSFVWADMEMPGDKDNMELWHRGAAFVSRCQGAGYFTFPYTSLGFQTTYSPAMANSGWLGAQALCLAQYFYCGKVIDCSWEEFRANWIPKYYPTLPNKCKFYSLWQFTGDRFRLPGCVPGASRLDVFKYDGSWHDFQALINMPFSEETNGTIVDPEPDVIEGGDAVEMKVIWWVEYLNIRAGRGMAWPVIGYMRGNNKFLADSKSVGDQWVKVFGEEKYVSGKYVVKA